MQSKNRYRGIDIYALSCVQYHAKRLAKLPCFTEADYEDIEQDLVLYFLKESPKFDPHKSDWKLHISLILKKRAVWLKEYAQTQKRGGRYRPVFMSELAHPADEFDQDMTSTVLSEDGLWGDAFFAWNHLNVEIREDIQRVIVTLPPRLQQLCEWLKERNASVIARDTGIPRTTISSAIGKIRTHMKEAGLENYFRSASSLSEAPVKLTSERAKTKETQDA